jgi:hypothetical protein
LPAIRGMPHPAGPLPLKRIALSCTRHCSASSTASKTASHRAANQALETGALAVKQAAKTRQQTAKRGLRKQQRYCLKSRLPKPIRMLDPRQVFYCAFSLHFNAKIPLGRITSSPHAHIACCSTAFCKLSKRALRQAGCATQADRRKTRNPTHTPSLTSERRPSRPI